MGKSKKSWARTRSSLVQRKLEALQHGEEPKVDLREELALERPGDVPGPDVRAIHELARRYQRDEDPDYVSISWANQVKAQDFFNEHGLAATLDAALGD